MIQWYFSAIPFKTQKDYFQQVSDCDAPSLFFNVQTTFCTVSLHAPWVWLCWAGWPWKEGWPAQTVIHTSIHVIHIWHKFLIRIWLCFSSNKNERAFTHTCTHLQDSCLRSHWFLLNSISTLMTERLNMRWLRTCGTFSCIYCFDLPINSIR